MTVTEDWSPGLTAILAFADSFLSDMKLFRSLHMWCEEPESATQVVLATLSAVSAIVVRWLMCVVTAGVHAAWMTSSPVAARLR